MKSKIESASAMAGEGIRRSLKRSLMLSLGVFALSFPSLFSWIVLFRSPLEALAATRRRRRGRGNSRQPSSNSLASLRTFRLEACLGFSVLFLYILSAPFVRGALKAGSAESRRFELFSRVRNSRLSNLSLSLPALPLLLVVAAQDVRSLCSPHFRPWLPVLGQVFLLLDFGSSEEDPLPDLVRGTCL